MNEITTLSEVFQKHLSWDKRRCDFAASYIIAALKVCTVNGIKIANALDGKSKKESKYRRLQRFFAEFSFRGEDIARMLLSMIPIPPPYSLSLDRTEWHFGKIVFNILVLGIIVEGTSMPIFWMMLPKAGNSRTSARQKLLKRLLLVMPAEHIAKLLGDREFIGQHWFLFLERRKIPLLVRLRAHTLIDTPQGKQQIQHALAWMRVGQRVRGRLQTEIYGVRFYISVMRLEHDWCIIAHQQQTRNAFAIYKKRWTIETLFASLKSRGFHLETTHLNDPARLWRLFALLAIALLWAYQCGIFLMEEKAITVKKHGRLAHSITAYGLQELQHSLLNSQHFKQLLI
ncbi:MAG: IS4 family transposase, partial [bacterium]